MKRFLVACVFLVCIILLFIFVRVSAFFRKVAIVNDNSAWKVSLDFRNLSVLPCVVQNSNQVIEVTMLDFLEKRTGVLKDMDNNTAIEYYVSSDAKKIKVQVAIPKEMYSKDNPEDISSVKANVWWAILSGINSVSVDSTKSPEERTFCINRQRQSVKDGNIQVIEVQSRK